MSQLQTYQVYPEVPENITFIETLLRNMWWCWNLDAIDLFRRVSPKLWEKAERNPIVFSTLIPQKRLIELSQDDSILAHQNRVKEKFIQQVLAPVDHSVTPYGTEQVIAYFSMEFGIHESLPIYAGGLGILAGDHLKAASDLKFPLVGVGLLFRGGYFHQFLDQNGWQQEAYPETDLFHLPIVHAKDPDGKRVRITLNGPDGKIHALVWEIKVGRVSLFLLDTNLTENSPEIREITHRLYAGEEKIRVAQEVLLGIGGMKALEVMGIFPKVIHMNEGHCTFASIMRLSQTMAKYSIDLNTALEIVPRATVFTTHTPVAAGHDEFPPDLVRPYLKDLAEKIDVDVEKLIALGQVDKEDKDSKVSMFVLGVRMAQHCNGVSELHGNVARGMWAHLWPEMPKDEVPIFHVTNGIHIPSWISIENNLLFERYLGPDWHLKTQNLDIVKRIDDIYDEELWRAHEMSRSRLIRHCRGQMTKQYSRRNAPTAIMKNIESVLDPDTLTIAFARRFATYKRAYLLLQDPARLESIINNQDRPVQFIFSGKAHPKDNEGKGLIQRIVQFAQQTNMRHRFIFLEDYDPNIARHLVQGADVWLNNPRRPLEACGTSGIKAAVNGVLNLSILDGWWCEGYSPETGWAIGAGEDYNDHGYQDNIEAQALYNALESEVVPCFYDRNGGHIPVRWLRMMKASMKMAMSRFCSLRMLNEYENQFYLPAADNFNTLIQDDAGKAKKIYSQRVRLQSKWNDIKIVDVKRDDDGPFRVGASFVVSAEVNLGDLTPEDVDVQLYYGQTKEIDSFTSASFQSMTTDQGVNENGSRFYKCRLHCGASGRFGFTVRIIPKGDDWLRFTPKMMIWA